MNDMDNPQNEKPEGASPAPPGRFSRRVFLVGGLVAGVTALVIPGLLRFRRSQLTPSVELTVNGPFQTADPTVVMLHPVESSFVEPRLLELRGSKWRGTMGVRFMFKGEESESRRIELSFEALDEGGNIVAMGSRKNIQDNRSRKPMLNGSRMLWFPPENLERFEIPPATVGSLAKIRLTFRDVNHMREP